MTSFLSFFPFVPSMLLNITCFNLIFHCVQKERKDRKKNKEEEERKEVTLNSVERNKGEEKKDLDSQHLRNEIPMAIL